jgi:hypothetical protein
VIPKELWPLTRATVNGLKLPDPKPAQAKNSILDDLQ